jgi:prophage antirepressor-like protein
MDFFKSFVFAGSDHRIRIIMETRDDPLFCANDVGKVLGIANIRSNIAKLDVDEVAVVVTDDPLGVAQKTNFLTELGVYKVMMRSNKENAKPFQKWVASTIKTIRQTGRYDLEQQAEKHTAEIKKMQESSEEKLQKARQQTETALMMVEDVRVRSSTKLSELQAESDERIREVKKINDLEMEIANHNSLVNVYHKKPVVYIGIITEKEKGKFIVKIGSSKNIRLRLVDLNLKYDRNFFYAHAFEVSESKLLDFERFMQKHPTIKPSVYRDVIVNGERSNEVFLMTKQQITTAAHIAKCNQKKFKTSEIEELKVKIDQLTAIINPNFKLQEPLTTEQDEEEPGKQEAATEDPPHIKKRTLRSRAVQKYSVDGTQLLQYYDTVKLALNDPEFNDISRSGMQNAVRDCVVYKGYRWYFVVRGATDQFNIPDTVDKPEYNFNAIVELDETGGKIVNAYATKSALGRVIGCNNGGRWVTNINRGKPVNGVTYMNVNKVDPAMLKKFLDDGGSIPDTHSYRKRKIEQISKSGEVVKTWETIKKVTNEFKLSDSTLHNAMNGKTEAKGFMWRWKD